MQSFNLPHFFCRRFCGKFFRRSVALFLIAAYFFTNASPHSYASALSVTPEAVEVSANLSSVQVPSALGKIEEHFQGPSSQTIILIQDAHAVPDAQRNIWKLIGHFEKQYGIRQVAVEGSAGELDAQFLKSFPDKEKLNRILEEYLAKGELAGANAAAVFSRGAVFRGIEDWRLYEEGLEYFLKAGQEEERILKKLKVQELKLRQEKQKVYSRLLLEIDQSLEDFQENHQNLEEVLTKIAEAALQRPAPTTVPLSIKMVFDEIQNKKGHWGKDEAEREARYSEMSSRFTAEFETYARAVKEKLFRNEQERKLDEQSRGLYLLKKIAKLELTKEEWEEIKSTKRQVPSTGEQDKRAFLGSRRLVLGAHFAFYKNAEQRDEVFFKQLRGLQENSLFVAGGFHTQGLAQKLKETGLSYVIIRPGIKDLPARSIYRQQMRGEVSWEKYFRVKHGKVNLYEAFARAVRDELLYQVPSAMDKETLGAWGLERGAYLKLWRDQIIRDLAREEKAVHARRYTRFLDELKSDSHFFRGQVENLQPVWMQRLDRFIGGLQKLQGPQWTAENIFRLFQPAAMPSAAVAGVFTPHSELRLENLPASTASRAELRADTASEEPLFKKLTEPEAGEGLNSQTFILEILKDTNLDELIKALTKAYPKNSVKQLEDESGKKLLSSGGGSRARMRKLSLEAGKQWVVTLKPKLTQVLEVMGVPAPHSAGHLALSIKLRQAVGTGSVKRALDEYLKNPEDPSIQYAEVEQLLDKAEKAISFGKKEGTLLPKDSEITVILKLASRRRSEIRIPYPRAGLKGLPPKNAEALIIDLDMKATRGFSVVTWPRRESLPFSEEEIKKFKTGTGLEQNFDPAAHEIERVRHTFYDRSSGQIEIWIAVKVKGRAEEYYLKTSGSDTSSMNTLKAMQPKFSELVDPAGAAFTSSIANLGDLPGYFLISSTGQNQWHFFGGNNEPWQRKSYRALVELKDGQRLLGSVSLEGDSKTNQIRKVRFQPLRSTLLPSVLHPAAVRFVLAAYTLGWPNMSEKALLKEYYTKYSDLRHVFAFPYFEKTSGSAEKTPLFYDQLLKGDVEKNLDMAYADRPLDFLLQYPDGRPVDAVRLAEVLKIYGYKSKESAEAVTQPGHYFISENNIRLIFLPAVYPINGLAVSKDGKHAALVTVKGISGNLGVRYKNFFSWIKKQIRENQGWSPAAFFVFDNGMDPQVTRRPGQIGEEILIKGGRNMVNAALNVLQAPRSEARMSRASQVLEEMKAVLDQKNNSETGWDSIADILKKTISKGAAPSGTFQADELEEVGNGLAVYWQRRGWHLDELYQFILFLEPSESFNGFEYEYTEGERRKAFLLAGDLKRQLRRDFLWGFGGGHIRWHGPHLLDVHSYPSDNEVLADTVRRFIPLLAAREEYGAEDPELTEDLLLWQLSQMTDPWLHDAEMGFTPQEGWRFWPNGFRQSAIYYAGRMFKDLKKVDAQGRPTGEALSSQKIAQILAKSLAMTNEDWKKRGLRPPSEFAMPILKSYLKAVNGAEKDPSPSSFLKAPLLQTVKTLGEPYDSEAHRVMMKYRQKYGDLVLFKLEVFLDWPEIQEILPGMREELLKALHPETLRAYEAYKKHFSIRRHFIELLHFLNGKWWILENEKEKLGFKDKRMNMDTIQAWSDAEFFEERVNGRESKKTILTQLIHSRIREGKLELLTEKGQPVFSEEDKAFLFRLMEIAGIPRSEMRSDEEPLSEHKLLFEHLLRLSSKKLNTSRDDLLKGKILNAALETGLGDALSPVNLVTILRKEGKDIVGLDPQAPDEPSAGYYRGVIQNIPFDAETFDTVASINLLEWMYLQYRIPGEYFGLKAFYAKAAEEIHRVLKPQGRFFTTTLHPVTDPEQQDLMDAFAAKGFEIIVLDKSMGGYLFIKKDNRSEMRTWAEELKKHYEADPAIAAEIAPLIEGGTLSSKEGNQIVTAASGQKLVEHSPFGTTRFFDLNGRWILTLDPYGNKIDELLWRENKFDMAWTLNGDRNELWLEAGSDGLVRSVDTAEEHARIYEFSPGIQFNEMKEVPYADLSGDFQSRDRRISVDGVANSVLRLMAYLAKDQKTRMTYVGNPAKDKVFPTDRLFNSLSEVARFPNQLLKTPRPIFNSDPGGFLTSMLELSKERQLFRAHSELVEWEPDPPERAFHPTNGVVVSVRRGQVKRALYDDFVFWGEDYSFGAQLTHRIIRPDGSGHFNIMMDEEVRATINLKGEILKEKRSEMRTAENILTLDGRDYQIKEKMETGLSVLLKVRPVPLDPAGGDDLYVKIQRFSLKQGENKTLHERETEMLRLWTAGDNPASIPLLDSGFDSSKELGWLVMPWQEGRNLSVWADQKSQGEVLDIFEKAIESVKEAHARGIVHGDIKPSNFIITPSHQLKLVDFGASQIKGRVLKIGQGTPSFSPYELIDAILAGQPRSPVTFDIDTFSLGMTLLRLATGYEGLTAFLPSPGKSRPAAVYHVLTHQLLPLKDRQEMEKMIHDRVPEEWKPFARFIAKAISFDPKGRYQTASEMLESFQTAREGRDSLYYLKKKVVPALFPGRNFEDVKVFSIKHGLTSKDLKEIWSAEMILAIGLGKQHWLPSFVWRALARWRREAPIIVTDDKQLLKGVSGRMIKAGDPKGILYIGLPRSMKGRLRSEVRTESRRQWLKRGLWLGLAATAGSGAYLLVKALSSPPSALPAVDLAANWPLGGGWHDPSEKFLTHPEISNAIHEVFSSLDMRIRRTEINRVEFIELRPLLDGRERVQIQFKSHNGNIMALGIVRLDVGTRKAEPRDLLDFQDAIFGGPFKERREEIQQLSFWGKALLWAGPVMAAAMGIGILWSQRSRFQWKRAESKTSADVRRRIAENFAKVDEAEKKAREAKAAGEHAPIPLDSSSFDGVVVSMAEEGGEVEYQVELKLSNQKFRIAAKNAKDFSKKFNLFYPHKVLKAAGEKAIRIVFHETGGKITADIFDPLTAQHIQNAVNEVEFIRFIHGRSEVREEIFHKIEEVVRKKEKEKMVLTLEGAAGTGKNFIADFIKEKGIGRFLPEEIKILDLDAYLPKIGYDDFGEEMIFDEETEVWFMPPPGSDFTNYINYARFENDYDDANQNAKLVIAAGVYLPRFLERIRDFRPDVRVKLQSSPEVGRMRVLRRSGTIRNYLDSHEVLSRMKDLSAKIPFDLILTNDEVPENAQNLTPAAPAEVSFVDPKTYGKILNESAYRISSQAEFDLLSREIEAEARAAAFNDKIEPFSHKTSDVESLAAGSSAVFRYLHNFEEKEMIVTLRRYEKGMELVFRGQKTEIPEMKNVRETILGSAMAHVPEMLIAGTQDWYARTFERRWEEKWIPQSGALYALGYPAVMPANPIGWRSKSKEQAGRSEVRPSANAMGLQNRFRTGSSEAMAPRELQSSASAEGRSEVRIAAKNILDWAAGEKVPERELKYSAAVTAKIGKEAVIQELEWLKTEFEAAQHETVQNEINGILEKLKKLPRQEYAIGYSIPKAGSENEIQDFVELIKGFGRINQVFIRREEKIPDQAARQLRDLGVTISRNLTQPVFLSADQTHAGYVRPDEDAAGLGHINVISSFFPVIRVDQIALQDPEISRLVLTLQTAVALLVAEEVHQRSELRLKPAELLKQYGLFAGADAGSIITFQDGRIEISSSAVASYVQSLAAARLTSRSA